MWLWRKEWDTKNKEEQYYYDACTVAAAVGEKARLGDEVTSSSEEIRPVA